MKEKSNKNKKKFTINIKNMGVNIDKNEYYEIVKSNYKVGQIGSAYTLIGEYSAYCDKSANARYGECLDTRKLKAEIEKTTPRKERKKL